FIIGDDEGNWMMVTDNKGSFQGFSAGHVTPMLTKRKVKGGESESKALTIQFLDRMQFDRNYVILHAAELDFTPSEIATVNGVDLSFSAIPSDTDTTLVVLAKLSADNNTIIEGLDDASKWQFKRSGTGSPITTVTEVVPGSYTFTVGAVTAGETISVDLYDTVLGVHIIDNEGVLLRSEALTTEVIA